MENIVQADTLSVLNEESCSSVNVWFWVALIEFVLIVVILFLKNRRHENGGKRALRAKLLGENVDFMNIIDSSFNAKGLYDELKKACHPDRFVDNQEKNRLATEISLEVAKNKNNIKKLIELRNEAIQKLGIKL